MITSEPTHWCQIFLGRRRGYDGPLVPESHIYEFIQHHCDEVGLCVTVTETTFIYKNGSEPGFIIGLINYPRFPKEPKDLDGQALGLAAMLQDLAGQYRVSIQTPERTYMLGDAGE